MIKTFKIIFFLLIFFSLIFIFTNKSFAQDCSNESDCKKLISEYESKLSSIRQEKNTLSSQISYMDTQIILTLTKIRETELTIKKTEDEILELTDKIENFDNSLNYLSKILIQKITEGYKNKKTSVFEMVLDNKNFLTLNNQLKYIRAAQENDRKIAYQVQQAKSNSEEQKKIREEKKIILDKLKETLNAQKASLNSQKIEKQKLLDETNSSETVYQNLLAAAYRQLSAFKSFVQSAGGGMIGANEFGTGEGGWYFSQRDSRWANNNIGNSSEKILDVGCLLTSVAMVLKQKGVDTNPAIVASNKDYFYLNTAYMRYRYQLSLPNGLKGISGINIDDELKNNNPVIVGLYAGSYGQHFIVLKKIDGDTYIINDPYYGPDKKFSDYYNKGQIFSAEVIK